MVFGKSLSTLSSAPNPSQASDGEILHLTLYDVGRNQAKEIPLRFVEIGGRPHILYAAKTPPEWVSTARESAFVRWSVGTRQCIGTVNPITDFRELYREVLPRFTTRFGTERILRWFPGEVGCMSLVESPGGIPYYHAVESLFDDSAARYDGVVQSNRFDMHLRNVALEHLRRLFRPGQRVLELGSGTGLETIPLAEAGVRLVALDISSGMLDRLGQKATAASVQDRIETRKVAIHELSDIVCDFGLGSFDGAFSHFGALNCEPHLESLPADLYKLLRPEARISLGIWNRTCIAEVIGYGIARRPGRAFARFQSSVPVGSSRFGVPVFPYSPREIERLFGPLFVQEDAIGVSVLMPPYNLGRRLLSHPDLTALLEAADRAVRHRRFLRYLGDHFLLTMRRR